MKTHWVADIYPINESDVNALAGSIKTDGQRVPIQILRDGTIIDGRNRWLACQVAGVEPITEVLNPDGEEMTDDQLLLVATVHNSFRRDLSTSARACSAAEAWKRLYPGENRKARNRKNAVSFESFAADRFKIGERNAQQALAILNHSPDLMAKAKDTLSDAYAIYQKRVATEKKELRLTKALDKPEAHDIRERVAAGSITLDEGFQLLMARDEEAAAREKERIGSINRMRTTLEAISAWSKYDKKDTAEAFKQCAQENFADDFQKGLEALAELEQ